MKETALEKKILPTVEGSGCRLWGLQVLPQGGKTLLRIYVDKPGGANIGDCQKINRRLLALFLVEPPVPGDYALEVSSPGMDRLLFNESQYGDQVGKRLQVRLRVPQEGHRQFQGTLVAVHEAEQAIELALTERQEVVKIVFGDIQQARVVPEWPSKLKSSGV